MPAERLPLGSLAHQRSEASCREQRVGCEIGAGPKGDTKLVFAGQDHFEHVQRIEPVARFAERRIWADIVGRPIRPGYLGDEPLDGDLVFSVATGSKPLADPLTDPFQLGHAAATCLARAIARAVYLARSEALDLQPSWQSRFSPKDPTG